MLTIQHIIEALEISGLNALPIAHSPALAALSDALETFGHTLEKLPANKLLIEL
jgi:hypothetical protein